MTRKELVYSDHGNSFPLKRGCLPKGLKGNHETAHVLEKDTLADKKMVSPVIREKHPNLYNHVLLLKLAFSLSHQFHQSISGYESL